MNRADEITPGNRSGGRRSVSTALGNEAIPAAVAIDAEYVSRERSHHMSALR